MKVQGPVFFSCGYDDEVGREYPRLLLVVSSTDGRNPLVEGTCGSFMVQ